MKKNTLILIYLILTSASCSKGFYNAYEQLNDPVLNQPVIITKAVNNITALSALSGGEVISGSGTAAVTARGVCWSVNPEPVITDACTNEGPGAGSFDSALSGLSPSTSYYVRAYASYKGGVSYGNSLYLTTQDSKNDITSFRFLADKNIGTLSADQSGIVVGTAITVYLPWGTSAANLVPTFTFTGAVVFVGTTVQVSGVTANDFSSAVVYRIVASDGTEKKFTVTIVPTYRVTYDANIPTGGMAPADLNEYVAGATVLLAYNTGGLYKTGLTFAGWNTQADGSGTAYSVGQSIQMASKNLQLYACWTTSPTYRVFYAATGADGGTAPEDIENYLQSAAVAIHDNGSLYKDKYYFGGWKNPLTGNIYQTGQYMPMGNANVTMEPVWSVVPKYTLTFDKNGANGGEVPSVNGSYSSGTTILIPGNEKMLSKINVLSENHLSYIFVGWNTKRDGSGIDMTNKTIKLASNVTLYAKWEACAMCGVGPAGGKIYMDTNSYGTHGISGAAFRYFEITEDLTIGGEDTATYSAVNSFCSSYTQNGFGGWEVVFTQFKYPCFTVFSSGLYWAKYSSGPMLYDAATHVNYGVSAYQLANDKHKIRCMRRF